MTLYLGVNSDGTEIISKQPLKRYIDFKTNEKDPLTYEDTQRPPHWMLDYTNIKIVGNYDVPIDRYLSLPAGSIEKMFGHIMTWEDEVKTVEL